MRFAVRYDKKHNSLETIGAWASGEPDELLDEWYDKYGSRNPNGDAKEILRGNGGSGTYQSLLSYWMKPMMEQKLFDTNKKAPSIN